MKTLEYAATFPKKKKKTIEYRFVSNLCLEDKNILGPKGITV